MDSPWDPAVAEGVANTLERVSGEFTEPEARLLVAVFEAARNWLGGSGLAGSEHPGDWLAELGPARDPDRRLGASASDWVSASEAVSAGTGSQAVTPGVRPASPYGPGGGPPADPAPGTAVGPAAGPAAGTATGPVPPATRGHGGSPRRPSLARAFMAAIQPPRPGRYRLPGAGEPSRQPEVTVGCVSWVRDYTLPGGTAATSRARSGSQSEGERHGRG